MGKHGATGHRTARSRSDISDTGVQLLTTGLIKYPDIVVLKTLLSTDWAGVVPVPIPAMISSAKKAENLLRVWIWSYTEQWRNVREPSNVEVAFQMWKSDWRIFRLVIPLQLRLIVEQILYDMGMPWRSLCTGFKPVSD